MFKLKHFSHTLAFLSLVYFSMFSLAESDVSLCGNLSEDTDKLVAADMELTENWSIVGNLCLLSGTLSLNGFILQVEGNLIQPGGILNANGNLIIIEDYRVQSFVGADAQESDGKLLMDNADSSIYVGGDFIMHSHHSHLGLLTGGELTVEGDFEQHCGDSPNCEQNFYASGDHWVKLNGDVYNRVWFDTPGAELSRFNHLERSGSINNWGEGCFVRNATCENFLSGLNVIDSQLTLDRDMDFEGDLYIRSSAKINLEHFSLTVNGNLFLEGGWLNVNEGKLIVTNNLYVQSKTDNGQGEGAPTFSDSFATIMMEEPQGEIRVLNHFYMQSKQAGWFDAGVIYIGGDFYQKRGIEDNFAANKPHKVVFNGKKTQQIYFENHDELTSHFGNLEIENCNVVFLDDDDNGYGYRDLVPDCDSEAPPEEDEPNQGDICDNEADDCEHNDSGNTDNNNTCDETECNGSNNDNNDSCDEDGSNCNDDNNGACQEDEHCAADDEEDLVTWDWQLTESSFICSDEILFGCDDNIENALVYDNYSRWQPKQIHRLGNDYRLVSDNRDLLIDFADEVLTKAQLATKGSANKEVLTLDFESHVHYKTAQASFDLDAVSWSMNIHDVKSDYQVKLAGSMGGTLFGLNNMLVSGEQIILDFKLLPGVELRTQAVLQFTEQGVELRVYKQAIGSSQYLFVQGTVLPNHSEISFSGRNVNIKTTFSTKQSVDDIDKNKIDKLKVAKE